MTLLIWFVLASSLVPLAQGDSADPLLQLPTPLRAVTKTPRPPQIDGKLSRGEWRRVASTTGLLNLADGSLASEQTVVYATYDSANLYVAFEALLATERSPAAAETRRDGVVWSDESFELYLQPPGVPDDKCCHFLGNSLGTIFDRVGADKTWNGDWQFANEVGMGHWTAGTQFPSRPLGNGTRPVRCGASISPGTPAATPRGPTRDASMGIHASPSRLPTGRVRWCRAP